MANKNEYDWAIDRLQDMRELDTTLSFDDEALELAIRSLEAWDKVKEEIELNMVSLDGLYSYQKSFHNNCNNVRKECIEIIDKHLSEVSE